MPPAQVVVQRLEHQPVEVWQEYTAEFRAQESAEIRSRVEGTLLEASFEQGGWVSSGQLLFQIDPAPYEANILTAQARVAQARGDLARTEGAYQQARAQLGRARNQVNFQQVSAQVARAQAEHQAAQRETERYLPLLNEGAIPSQRFDEASDRAAAAKAELDSLEAQLLNTKVSDTADVGAAEANLSAAQADITAARAAVQSALSELEKAQLNLSFTRIRAPFSGIAGTLEVDPGSLILPGQTRLTVLSQSDPIYAEVHLSEREYLTQTRSGSFDESSFRLALADGTPYPEEGTFVLVERDVSLETGTVMLRVRFPNSQHLLKPGGFGRLSMRQQRLTDALVVPERALTNFQAKDAVYVVAEDDTAALRPVTIMARVKKGAVISEGLEVGDRLIVDGLQQLRSGVPVTVSETGQEV